MPTFTKETWVEVDIDVEPDEFHDEELIEELKDRGYSVTKGPEKDNDLSNVAWLLTLNKTEEALIQLERLLPELEGIHRIIKKAGVV